MSQEDAYEDMLRQQLSDLQRSYEKSARPIIDRLVALQNLKPPPPLWIHLSQLSEADKQALEKAVGDLVGFGTGMISVTADGITHVPPSGAAQS